MNTVLAYTPFWSMASLPWNPDHFYLPLKPKHSTLFQHKQKYKRVVVFQNVYSTVLCIKHLRGCCWDSLAPRHRHPGVSLGQMVSELLKVRIKKKIKLTNLR